MATLCVGHFFGAQVSWTTSTLQTKDLASKELQLEIFVLFFCFFFGFVIFGHKLKIQLQ